MINNTIPVPARRLRAGIVGGGARSAELRDPNSREGATAYDILLLNSSVNTELSVETAD